MSGGNYYVPDSSRYPIFAAVSLFLLVMGAGGTINGTANGVAVLYIGFASMAVTMFFWFRTVVQEHLAGLDSAQLKKSYVFGMAWFIFSEVMFFAAFFGALFYVRTFAVPWLAGEGEKGAPIEFVQEMGVDFWTGFENTWPVIATPDAGDGYVMADKSMAFPGWSHVLEWLPLWNTIILLSSSVTVHFAHLGLKNGSRKSFIQHHDTGDTLKIASEFGAISLQTSTDGNQIERMSISSGGATTLPRIDCRHHVIGPY